jgi:hypothetical protein
VAETHDDRPTAATPVTTIVDAALGALSTLGVTGRQLMARPWPST